ncbi:hypothetical protein ACP70R_021623 [Stipagrostis hirtigluma subsp. patula]
MDRPPSAASLSPQEWEQLLEDFSSSASPSRRDRWLHLSLLDLAVAAREPSPPSSPPSSPSPPTTRSATTSSSPSSPPSPPPSPRPSPGTRRPRPSPASSTRSSPRPTAPATRPTAPRAPSPATRCARSRASSATSSVLASNRRRALGMGRTLRVHWQMVGSKKEEKRNELPSKRPPAWKKAATNCARRCATAHGALTVHPRR